MGLIFYFIVIIVAIIALTKEVHLPKYPYVIELIAEGLLKLAATYAILIAIALIYLSFQECLY